ncbi:hypothetical protein EU527_04570 [Candidatus Thorarchaeota archaeon]|nr:MAG: hypothetical protein EU527_04570 [Candidatus Thorarchaeota archaeon]
MNLTRISSWTSMLVCFTILILCIVPSFSAFNMNQTEPNTVGKTSQIDEPLSTPVRDATPAEVTWNLIGASTLASAPWGSADFPHRLSEDDGSLCQMSEEFDGTNWKFDLRFRTRLTYVHRYLTHQLRLDFTQVWSLTPEDLKFYIALGTSSGSEGSYSFVGQLSGPGLHTFSLEQDILFDSSIISARYVYVRILGAIETSDPSNGNIWNFDLLQIAYCNFAPRLKSANVDRMEGDVVYARLGASGNNYATITIEAECWDGGSEFTGIFLRYENGADYWQASWTTILPFPDTSLSQSSNWVEYIDGEFSISYTTVTVTWYIRFNWNHPETVGMELTLRTLATTLEPVIVEMPWRVETGLDMVTTPSIEESRVRTGGSCSYSGDIEYSGSSGHWSPLPSEVDILVRRNNPEVSDWIYTTQPNDDGTFTVEPNTASISSINTFELKAVAHGTATNLLSSTYSDTVIGDCVVVTSVGSEYYNSAYGGGVRNAGQTETLFLELEWESSSLAITSANSVTWSAEIDRVTMNYDNEDSRWEGVTYLRSTVGEQVYDDLIVVVDEITYAIVGDPSYRVVWDEILVLTTIIEGGDDYVNIGNSVTIRVTAELDYLGHTLVPGVDTLYMNGIAMSNGGTCFIYSLSYAFPNFVTLSVDYANALEATYGITKVSSGVPSVSCTWDTFAVDLSVDDAHASITDTVRVWACVTRAYDASIFTSSMGTVTLRHTTGSDVSMTYSPEEQMWYADMTQTSIGQWVYYIYSISDSIEGITTVGKGLHFDGFDDYVDCGSDSSLDLTSSLTLSAWFYGDGSSWSDGMYLLAKKDANNAQYSLYINDDGTLRLVYYNGAIREIDLQSGVTRNSWHHIIVTISGIIMNAWYDGTHVQDDYTMPVALVSYSSVPLYLGAQKSGTGTDHHLEGFLAEVLIYSTILTDSQCELLYQGEYPTDTNLELHLKRTSIYSAGSDWIDISTNTNDGTINGACMLIGSIPMRSDEIVRIIWDGVIITLTNPIYQTLELGENATGIIVTAYYAYEYLPFDGIVELNNTIFSYMTPGQRGYTVSSVSGGSYNITVILQNDETYAIWVLKESILYLEPSETSILVSTVYDPQFFSIEIFLTDSELDLIPGWVNLSICGDWYSVYCNGIVTSVFNYTPVYSGVHILDAFFQGDLDYSPAETNILLTAVAREIVFASDISTTMIPMTPIDYGFLQVYDYSFQGEYQNVMYLRNFPINASFSIWWTISSDYGYPRTFMGTWYILSGEGYGTVVLPWDLDGNGRLSDTDFTCYIIILLDGLGIYENSTIEVTVNILQPLEIDLQIPALTYSDESTVSLHLCPLYDYSYSEGLDITINLYVSSDNSSWVFICEATTESGWLTIDWMCTYLGSLFFKIETETTDLYTESIDHAYSVAGKESTVLTIAQVGNFTYSDQGVLTACLLTDDGEPLYGYSIYLEIMDGSWISIGSGLTNESGYASILWIPTLPAGLYSIQLRAALAESQYYLMADNPEGELTIGKEITVVTIDSTTAAQGYVHARVTDDEGNPISQMQVHFYLGSEHDYQGAGTTDNDGYARLNITFNNGELIKAVVNEDDFYYGSTQEVTVALPPDLMFIGTVVCSIFLVAAGIAVGRKVILGRRVLSTPSVSPEVSRALEEERDSIPERVREYSERKIAELDEMSRDGGVPSDADPEGKVEWNLDSED